MNQPIADWPRPEAGKQRHDDCADLGNGKKGRCHFRHHRQVECNHVALLDTQFAQSAREAAGFCVQLRVAPAAHCAIFAFPHHGLSFPDRRPAMAVERISDQIGGAANAPAWPLDAPAQIENVDIGSFELHRKKAKHRIPQPCWIGISPGAKCRVIRQPVRMQEGADGCARQQCWRRFPHKMIYRHVGSSSVRDDSAMVRALDRCRVATRRPNANRHLAARFSVAAHSKPVKSRSPGP